MSNGKSFSLIRLLYRFALRPVIWLLLLVYMAFESLWEAVSDWVFSYTPLLLFSEKIHDYLVGHSRWLVLCVYLIHFIAMQGAAVLSGKLFLAGNFAGGVVFYFAKGILAIPTVRFFSMEKGRLLTFAPVRLVYTVVLWIKASEPYRFVAGKAVLLKNETKALVYKVVSAIRQRLHYDA